MLSLRSRATRFAAKSLAVLALSSSAFGAAAPASATANATAATGIDLCAQVAKQAGFSRDTLVTAIAVAMAESHCNPQASHVNSNGTVDYGLWQINTVHPQAQDPNCRFDPQCNANAAWEISKHGTNFCPWSTYDSTICTTWVHNNAYRTYLAAAQAAAARVSGGGSASLAGDGRASVVSDSADGTLTAWHNAAGFAQMPFDTSAVIGQGFMDPTRVKFADLDGDGRADLIYDQPAGNPQNDPEGTLRAWHNDGGMNTMPFGNSVIIGQGFMDPTRVKFADLDGDGRADLIYDQPANNPQNDPAGTLRAWHNDNGMNTMPFGNSVIIGQGFTNPTSTYFA
ncbi:transglycosylase SLT domain-containing protein [Kitasatospora sp. NPDC059747]|uniref:transglycosylase SLT domain-containing protein n=1 Tax=Kitasatospora sp. NPDC059747 TaxID=3346930 RepID=UPI0036514E0C